MPKIRVLLVDDHPVLRLGVRELLSAEPDMEVVGEANDGLGAVELARELRPDVAVVDIAMPGIDGLETTRRIVALGADCKVLILTVHAQEHYLLHLLKVGALGYLPKTAAYGNLVAAVRSVACGQIYLLPDATQLVVNGFLHQSKTTEANDEAKLSVREQEVLRRAAAGQTSEEIAQQLQISRNTVDTYRRRLMEKLGFKKRAELVRYALRRGMLPLPHND